MFFYKMPMFVWVGVLAIFLAIAYQIVMAKNLIIDLNDRTIEVERAEKAVAEKEAVVEKKEKKVVEVADRAINHLERLKATVPPAERDRFSVAQMTLRDEVRKPILRTAPEIPERKVK